MRLHSDTNLTALAAPPELQAINRLIRRAQANMLEAMAHGSKRKRSTQLPPQVCNIFSFAKNFVLMWPCDIQFVYAMVVELIYDKPVQLLLAVETLYLHL
jgi:hypothetical protein